jgi:hypothetical protein
MFLSRCKVRCLFAPISPSRTECEPLLDSVIIAKEQAIAPAVSRMGMTAIRKVKMKVTDSQTSNKTGNSKADGVSRETLNEWQRKDAARRASEAKDPDPKGAKS